MESGAMDGAGAIHISEIEPTLSALEKVLGMDLLNNTLGSVGKKEFSGDIDVALDISAEEVQAFVEKLKTIPEIKDIAQSSVVMTKVKIVGYDPKKETDKTRTGYVQLDFMIGDPDWLKVFYHAPAETESQYKGLHRTELLKTVAALHDRNDSKETLDDGRPLASERYMFSPKLGLVRIKRTPVPKKNGEGYTKQNNNDVVGGPWKTAEEVAQQLNLGGAEAINSYETLTAAINSNYPKDIVKKIMDGFAKNPNVMAAGIPK